MVRVPVQAPGPEGGTADGWCRAAGRMPVTPSDDERCLEDL